jgi:Protein-tyrosine phosphatase
MSSFRLGENLLNDAELLVRYHPPPKRLGELVKKANIVDYVERNKQNGQMRQDFEVFKNHFACQFVLTMALLPQMLPRGQQKSWNVGMSPSNKNKNRYANIAAYDCNRVCLGDTQDYINASFIEVLQFFNYQSHFEKIKFLSDITASKKDILRV